MDLPSRRFVTWLERAALPFWRARAWDTKHGGWFERLDNTGAAEREVSRRTRVQARQIVTFSQAANLGWDRDQYIDLALESVEWWLDRCWAKGGLPGFCHTLGHDLIVEDPKRDTYDHAFAILALAWAYRVSGDAQIRAILMQVTAFIDEHLLHKEGGLIESTVPQTLGAGRQILAPQTNRRRQNPHMHLFEACAAAIDTLRYHGDDYAWFSKMFGQCRDLFHTYFFDLERGWVIEHFDAAWQPERQTVEFQRLEPGHSAEWAWLLYDAHQKLPDLMGAWTPSKYEVLNHFARQHGKLGHSAKGDGYLLVDWFNPNNGITAPTARSWPTMELARAGIAFGDEEQWERGCEALFDNFILACEVTPPNSGQSLWGGYRDSVQMQDNESAAQPAALPRNRSETFVGGALSMQTSTLYHYMGVAIALLQRE